VRAIEEQRETISEPARDRLLSIPHAESRSGANYSVGVPAWMGWPHAIARI